MPRLTGALTSYICRQSEVGIVVRSSIAVLVRYLLPDLWIDWGEQRIPIGRSMHMGDLQPIGHRHGCGKNIAAADHHDFIDATLGCILRAKLSAASRLVAKHGARRDKNEIAREHDIGAALEHLSDELDGSCGP